MIQVKYAIAYLSYKEIARKGIVKILMIKYVHNVLDAFPGKVKPTSVYLTSDHLFQIRNEDKWKFLPVEPIPYLHSYHPIARLLSICMRTWKDLEMAVSLLIT